MFCNFAISADVSGSHRVQHGSVGVASFICNTYFTSNLDNLKLCDFGLCKLLEPGQTACDRCGTPVTLSPEVVRKTWPKAPLPITAK